MNPNRSPGSDVLPTEFYELYFPRVGNHCINVINKAFNDEILAKSQRLGLIRLLCKDLSKPDQLTNWRPISLIYVDYKIISKLLANRLSKVIGNVVRMDQTCAILNRYIIENLHLVRNAIDYCLAENISCAIISYDQAKAFDRFSHEYLFAVLT